MSRADYEEQRQSELVNGFIVKDSGERKEFASGMVRDTATGKIDYHRVAGGPMLKRWADHLTKGATKYPDVAPGKPNWTLAAGEEERARFKASAFRHFMQWFNDERDEDHGAAVFFNINGAEYVRAKLDESDKEENNKQVASAIEEEARRLEDEQAERARRRQHEVANDRKRWHE